MKRRHLIAGLAGLGIGAANPVLAQPRPRSGEKPFRIYMALFRGWEDCAQGFKDYFVNQGIPVELIVRDAGQDKSKLAGFVAEAKEMKVDLVFTWGTTVTQEMLGPWDKPDPARHITDIPAVFAIVSQPVGAKVVPDLVSSRRNVTGTTYLVPLETQMALIQSYRPFSVLGMVYNPLEPASRITIDELTALGRQLDFRLEAVPVDVADGKPQPTSIPAKVAEVKAAGALFLYIPPDTFINVNRDVLTGAALEAGLPSFAAAENPVVNSKAMFGAVCRYYPVGQLTAYKAEQILVQKRAPADIPIDAPKRMAIMINMPVVRALGFYPPMNLLGLSEVIDPESRP
ncbi:ABC transporter substrate-binding protein [Magnetospirillum aberrantis]|uniref:ABC transporter substrate-binding protein n=1 Tax=Magnetospirillum aberrantis SpK TaxID=908842 RepID=A0A7C9QS55_9PROT|nr:ABC transporter substrate-binding protein [Magnetospirillum aberrantis]NFV78861.1 ABC transporter substrate-binding protein [Magnetospirillum aberrantis SpK]